MLYLKQGIQNIVYANLLDSRDNPFNPGFGSELIQNPDFNVGSDEVDDGNFPTGTTAWTTEPGWEIINGRLEGNITTTSASTTQGGYVFSGKTFKVVYTVTDYIQGEVRIYLGGSQSTTNRSANGTYTEYIAISGGNTTLYIQGIGNFIGNIDNISVKEVGEHWNNPDGSVTFTTGSAKIDVLYANNRLSQNQITGDDLRYRVTYVISENIGTTQLSFYVGNQYSIKDGTVGTHTFDYTRAGTDDNIFFKGDNGTSITIDSISVKSFIDNPFSWLINITNDFTKESTTLLQIPDASLLITPGTNTVSYPINVITTGTANGLLQEVLLENTGYYSYEIYKQDSVTNLDITDAVVGKLVESGKALIYNADSEVTYKEHPDGNPNNFIYVP